MENYKYELELYRAANVGGVYTVRMDEGFTLLYGNDLYFQLYECEPERMLGISCKFHIYPEDYEYVKAVVNRAKSRGEKQAQFEMRVFTGDHQIKHVFASGIFNVRNGEEVFDGFLIDISRQKAVEEALRLSEEKFRIATKNTDIDFWSYDIKRKAIIQTATAEIIENIPGAMIEAGNIRKDSISDFREMYQKLQEGEPSVSGDFWVYNRDNDVWWCQHIDYTTVYDAAGTPCYAHAVSQDVTALKIAEKRFNDEMEYSNATQSDKLLVKVRSNITQNMVESYVANNMVGISQNGTPYTVGTEQLAQTGYTHAEREKIRHMLNRDRVLQAFENGENHYSLDYQRMTHDGDVIWVNTTVKTYQNPETKDIMSFMYSYDINEERIKDGIIQAVSELEHDYVAYVNLKNEQYKVYFGNGVNGQLPPQYGDDYTESVTRINCAMVVPADQERIIQDMLPENIKKNLCNQRVYSTVCDTYDQNKNIRHKRIQYAYLDEASEQIVMTRSDITDLITQQKQQQDMLQTALLAAEQANSAKSDFLSRMSPEIRTPMNAIIGMSTIAAQSIGDDAQVADCISKIGISSRFLLSLINDILDMSRIESGKMLLKNEKIPFEEFMNGINSICYTQADAKNIDYENIVDTNVDDFYIGDAMKLQQIVINILSNALKFTPENGKVSVRVREMKREKKNAILRFVINDTGCGISEEFLPKLFEPFAQEHSGTTTMYGGTGLGLAICKNLVEMMDGKISVRSIVDVGSEFTVDVKLGVTEESLTRHLKKTEYNFSQLKALVVDDDVTVCEYAVITLKEIGVKSEWVDSGMKAVSRVEEKWRRKEYYDLVLVDWKMPEMDGIETARRIRAIVGPDVTIIIMTAYDWAAIEHEAKLAGVNLLMSKPMFKSSLLSAFEKAFLKKDSERDTLIREDFRFDGKRVLLAEDHPLNVEVATRLLERRGFDVEQAENGLRAMEMFTTTPVGYYDAILMDIRMPEMDGLQATYNIRHWTKGDAKTIPIIAMTANAFDDDIQKSKAAGMNAHLAKPIEPHLMYQTLYDFIYAGKGDVDE